MLCKKRLTTKLVPFVDPTEARKGGAANVAQPLRETTRSPDAGPGRILRATRRPSEIGSASAVYFGTTSGELYGSWDAGDTWRRLPGVFPRILSVHAIAA